MVGKVNLGTLKMMLFTVESNMKGFKRIHMKELEILKRKNKSLEDKFESMLKLHTKTLNNNKIYKDWLIKVNKKIGWGEVPDNTNEAMKRIEREINFLMER